MRRSAISYARVSRRSAVCVRPVSSLAFSCVMAVITIGRVDIDAPSLGGRDEDLEQAANHIVLEDCIAAVEAAKARRDRLEAHIEAALPDWSLAPVVRALQALRGMALVAAATVIAELGDITRFANPRQLMAYLGLVPSEHSSGSTRRQGGITKAGNGAARRMLIEAAWSYRFPARISREQLLRQEGLAKPIRDTAWKAQERLCRRYRKLARAGKSPTVVTTAIARELAAFAWAIAKHVQIVGA